jgi:hypothetical protein
MCPTAGRSPDCGLGPHTGVPFHGLDQARRQRQQPGARALAAPYALGAQRGAALARAAPEGLAPDPPACRAVWPCPGALLRSQRKPPLCASDGGVRPPPPGVHNHHFAGARCCVRPFQSLLMTGASPGPHAPTRTPAARAPPRPSPSLFQTTPRASTSSPKTMTSTSRSPRPARLRQPPRLPTAKRQPPRRRRPPPLPAAAI